MKVMLAMKGVSRNENAPPDLGGAVAIKYRLSNSQFQHQWAAEGGRRHPWQLVGHTVVFGHHFVELIERDLHRQARNRGAQAGVYTTTEP
jgi:hypothetical protein